MSRAPGKSLHSQSQDLDWRPCQEEWSQLGFFLGPAGSVGVALAPEWQGEHVTGPTSVPPAHSEHVESPKSAPKLWGAREAGSQGSCASQGGEREWQVTLRPRALQRALVAMWLWHYFLLLITAYLRCNLHTIQCTHLKGTIQS